MTAHGKFMQETAIDRLEKKIDSLFEEWIDGYTEEDQSRAYQTLRRKGYKASEIFYFDNMDRHGEWHHGCFVTGRR